MLYEGALEIRRELARKDPETYLPDVAMTLYSLGILDGEQNRNRAREAYEEALRSIRRELARKNAEVHLPYVATILHNLAILDSEQNREEEARRGMKRH